MKRFGISKPGGTAVDIWATQPQNTLLHGLDIVFRHLYLNTILIEFQYDTVSFLTLDRGSVLYTPDQMPSEIVLKHTDGELIKIERDDEGKWLSKRRKELEINFCQDGEYESTTDAVATLADRQAFGFRLNGEAVNPLSPGIASTAAETIEIEGLDLGGVIFEDNRQLPFAVYTKTKSTTVSISQRKRRRVRA